MDLNNCNGNISHVVPLQTLIKKYKHIRYLNRSITPNGTFTRILFSPLNIVGESLFTMNFGTPFMFNIDDDCYYEATKCLNQATSTYQRHEVKFGFEIFYLGDLKEIYNCCKIVPNNHSMANRRMTMGAEPHCLQYNMKIKQCPSAFTAQESMAKFLQKCPEEVKHLLCSSWNYKDEIGDSGSNTDEGYLSNKQGTSDSSYSSEDSLSSITLSDRDPMYYQSDESYSTREVSSATDSDDSVCSSANLLNSTNLFRKIYSL